MGSMWWQTFVYVITTLICGLIFKGWFNNCEICMFVLFFSPRLYWVEVVVVVLDGGTLVQRLVAGNVMYSTFNFQIISQRSLMNIYLKNTCICFFFLLCFSVVSPPEGWTAKHVQLRKVLLFTCGSRLGKSPKPHLQMKGYVLKKKHD